jgi:hypothetical protein
MPVDFYAVAQVYKHWYDVPDEEVLEIMKQWKKILKERKNGSSTFQVGNNPKCPASR